MDDKKLYIGWTTFDSKVEARKIAKEAVESHLAICVQIDSKIESFYMWHRKLENAKEIRVCFKFLENQKNELEKWLMERHPYDIPQWVVVKASDIGTSYLKWAMNIK